MFSCISKLFKRENKKKTLYCDVLNVHNADYYNTEFYIPQITYGKVIKVYGDGIILIAAIIPESGVQIYKFAITLRHSNNFKKQNQSFMEKQLETIARDTFYYKIINKPVEVRNIITDKLGGLIADVYLENMCINDWLVQCNYTNSVDNVILYAV
jgi:hypothetical protein